MIFCAAIAWDPVHTAWDFAVVWRLIHDTCMAGSRLPAPRDMRSRCQRIERPRPLRTRMLLLASMQLPCSPVMLAPHSLGALACRQGATVRMARAWALRCAWPGHGRCGAHGQGMGARVLAKRMGSLMGACLLAAGRHLGEQTYGFGSGGRGLNLTRADFEAAGFESTQTSFLD
eukprot:362004-Chlamydomonas_euryale.AAC.4